MNAPLVVVFPRGQLQPKDKERLTKAGIIAVEADDPQQVCQLHLAPPMVTTKINGDGLLLAALSALASQPSIERGYTEKISAAGLAKGEFVRLLAEALKPEAGK